MSPSSYLLNLRNNKKVDCYNASATVAFRINILQQSRYISSYFHVLYCEIDDDYQKLLFTHYISLNKEKFRKQQETFVFLANLSKTFKNNIIQMYDRCFIVYNHVMFCQILSCHLQSFIFPISF